MGAKTIVNSKGIFTQRVSGSDDFAINVPKKHLVVSAAGNTVISNPVTVLNPTALAGVTGTLPTLTSENGTVSFMILKNNNAFPALVSGTNPIEEGGALTKVLSGPFALELQAVPSASSYYWHIVSSVSGTIH